MTLLLLLLSALLVLSLPITMPIIITSAITMIVAMAAIANDDDNHGHHYDHHAGFIIRHSVHCSPSRFQSDAAWAARARRQRPARSVVRVGRWPWR